jgi:predicted nucleic acid-binding protein
MILVDTSVWIHHFRSGNARLRELLQEGEVAMHAMVLGELACGNLGKRAETLRLLGHLPRIPQAPDHLVLRRSILGGYSAKASAGSTRIC